MPAHSATADTPTDSTWDAASFRASVQSVLDEFLDSQAEVLADLGADAERLLARAHESLSGGKRFRAAFCWWGYRAVRPEVENPEALVKACAALELLQASALVHDDLMDASDTRRGRPSSHKALEAEHAEAGWRGDTVQYGAAGAILLGDLLLAWSGQLLRHCGLPIAQVSAALDVFDLCRTEVIAGQFLDVSVQARGHAGLTEAMTVLRYKSAKYSIERPLHIGAALAGADAATLDAISAYGLPLGEAFQLRDDVLGVYGDPATTGKPAGDDLVEGKRTVLVAHALAGATPEDATTLDEALGHPLDEAAVAELRRIITDSGAEAAVEETITALTEQCLVGLERAELAPGATAVLRRLAIDATQRAL
ncbi:polyprenyl synthetase family protein [Nocardioides yefusunii]|uniref:Polyprenyl synthetase family protein n=1 Tax=Nocardioides yefusunii TaxID=2500546 RepID=A0ABW1QV05_9ACTN|nr:polyprenyl synthetase family protein [Nocardioides yefusunii]